MTNFKGNYVTRDDVKIAQNYLTELELQRLNLLTSQFLDYAEFQALEQNPMTMADWIAALDDQILRLRKNILEGAGTVSHQEAIEKAEQEFEIYREREMRMLESDFDKAVKRLKNIQDNAEEENQEQLLLIIHLARHYYIYGMRGGIKKIDLPRELVVWEYKSLQGPIFKPYTLNAAKVLGVMGDYCQI